MLNNKIRPLFSQVIMLKMIDTEYIFEFGNQA